MHKPAEPGPPLRRESAQSADDSFRPEHRTARTPQSLRRAVAASRDPSGSCPHATAPRRHGVPGQAPRSASILPVAVHVLRPAPLGVNRENRRMISSARSTAARGHPNPSVGPLRRCVIPPIYIPHATAPRGLRPDGSLLYSSRWPIGVEPWRVGVQCRQWWRLPGAALPDPRGSGSSDHVG